MGDTMKRTGPFLTLLAGLAVAAVLVVLNMNIKSDAAPAAQKPAGNNVAAETGPQDAPADVPPVAEEPKPPAAPLNVTWAGFVLGGKASVAIVAKDKQAIAYVCDGTKVEAWLKGTATDGELNLTGGKDATLTGTFGNGRAKGTVVVGAKEWTFDVGSVKKPSGLYRATANVRNARVVGGWIVLADGTQVGVLTRSGAPQAAPRIDLNTGRTTVDGATITAGAVDPDSAGF
jgi:hypothetical protein